MPSGCPTPAGRQSSRIAPRRSAVRGRSLRRTHRAIVEQAASRRRVAGDGIASADSSPVIRGQRGALCRRSRCVDRCRGRLGVTASVLTWPTGRRGSKACGGRRASAWCRPRSRPGRSSDWHTVRRRSVIVRRPSGSLELRMRLYDPLPGNLIAHQRRLGGRGWRPRLRVTDAGRGGPAAGGPVSVQAGTRFC